MGNTYEFCQSCGGVKRGMNQKQIKQDKIPVVEIFKSISGEGITSGFFVTFVRVAGCNLRCSYCDTTYSYEKEYADNMCLTLDEIYQQVKTLGCKDVICTGGEPLEHDTPKRYLPLYLASKGLQVRIETNGSCEVYSQKEVAFFMSGSREAQVQYTLDIKCPGSSMHQYNIFEHNFKQLLEGDELKFVVSGQLDIAYALDVIEAYKDIFKAHDVVINFSPVYGKMDAREIVDTLKQHPLLSEQLKIRISLQLHKMIWPPEMRGV